MTHIICGKLAALFSNADMAKGAHRADNLSPRHRCMDPLILEARITARVAHLIEGCGYEVLHIHANAKLQAYSLIEFHQEQDFTTQAAKAIAQGAAR